MEYGSASCLESPSVFFVHCDFESDAHGCAVVHLALRSDTEVYVGGTLTVEFDIEGDVTGPYEISLVKDGDTNEEVRVCTKTTNN